MKDKPTPKVSVCMITYNHEKFIAQAIESVLMQQTDFPFELIIGEDCSTDGTAAIVRDYAEKYPDIIVPIIRDKNIGARKNSIDILSRPRGEFVALLEGDDYWTDPLKLQKQIDFFNKHPNCVSCAGISRIVDENNHPTGETYPVPIPPEISGFEEIIQGQYMPTNTVMYRREAFDLQATAEWWGDLAYGDWPLQVMLSLKGSLGFINEILADFHLHPGGCYSTLSHVQKRTADLKNLTVLKSRLPEKYLPLVNERIHTLKVNLFLAYLFDGKWLEGIRYFFKLQLHYPFKRNFPNINQIKWLIKYKLNKA